jgi:hypothetical protein
MKAKFIAFFLVSLYSHVLRQVNKFTISLEYSPSFSNNIKL